MTNIEIPAYVDPAVLVPGATVYAMLGSERTPLTVLRVEPAIICSAPDGTELVILAHTAVPTDGPVPGAQSQTERTS